MSSKIFINYRKEDSPWNSLALYQELTQHFPKDSIFKDFNTIVPGQDFVEIIENALKSCDVLLVLISSKWLTIEDKKGAKRIHNSDDFVRLEIATALKRNIYVIPVLFDDAELPQADELPDDLRKLSRRQYVEIDKTRFETDIAKLVTAIEHALSLVGKGAETIQREPNSTKADIKAGEDSIGQQGDERKKAQQVRMDEATQGEAQSGRVPEITKRSYLIAAAVVIASVVVYFIISAQQRGEFEAIVEDSSGYSYLPDRPTSMDSSNGVTYAANADELVSQGFDLYNQKRYTEAYELWIGSADLGNGLAMNNLGVLYRDGLGVEQNYSKALSWFQKSADLGNALGMVNLGALYNNGNGVPKDYSKAFYWFQRSADGGNTDGMNNLGLLYDKGNGVSQDYANAAHWYQKAADLGHGWAMNNIGLFYRDGLGVTRDHNQALKWLRASADRENPNGMANLGYMYEKGFGTAPDMDTAVLWYKKAAKVGSEWAISRLKQLGEG